MPLAVDLCCGRGGWTRGLLAAGWDVVGFDIVRYRYPGQLVLQDVRTLSGVQMRGRVSLVVGSSPCQYFVTRTFFGAKRIRNVGLGVELAMACFRVGREAGCPMILENIRDAQTHLGTARAHCGSFYFWGDVPALLPIGRFEKGMHRCKLSGARSSHRDPAIRSMVPFEVSRWIGKCFLPRS